jgi:hypothetical protein
MTRSHDSRLIEVEAIVVAYAMSRLNTVFLERLHFRSWKNAFTRTGDSLGVPPASMKNLRDEFDPIHSFRKGWHQRPLRPNRQRVLAEFCEVGDEALLEIVGRILHRDQKSVEEIVRPLAFAKERIENVAERLRTGRLAEEFFLANSEPLCGLPSKTLVDRRQDAAGFDFSVVDRPQLAIEVKGLKESSGSVLFTDLEWRTACTRGNSYWLVVVGSLAATPKGKLWRDPAKSLTPKSDFRRTTIVSWKVRLTVA